jgi:hypothetical protein
MEVGKFLAEKVGNDSIVGKMWGSDGILLRQPILSSHQTHLRVGCTPSKLGQYPEDMRNLYWNPTCAG